MLLNCNKLLKYSYLTDYNIMKLYYDEVYSLI